MNKSCHWVLVLLITVEVTIHVSCIDFNNWRQFAHRGTFYLHPSPDEEYISPAPINLFKPHYRRPINTEPSTRPESMENHQRPWRPSVRNSRGFATVAREAYGHPRRPISYRDNAAVSAASPSVVTAEPQTFDIPLKKSIRVSNSALNHSAIQTTGYIKNTDGRKFPESQTTHSPRHKVIVDNVKQTTTKSEVNATEFDDGWKPKRIPYFKPIAKPMLVHMPPPLQFTRFSDTKFPNLSDKQTNNGGVSHLNIMRPSPDSTNDKTVKKLINNVHPHVRYLNDNLDTQDSSAFQPSSTRNNNKDSGDDLKNFGERPLVPQNNNNGPPTNKEVLVKIPSRNNLFGVQPKTDGSDQSSFFKTEENLKDKSVSNATNKLIEIVNPTNDDVFFQQYPSIKAVDRAKEKIGKVIILDTREGSGKNALPKLEINSFNQENKFGTSLPEIPTEHQTNPKAFIEYSGQKNSKAENTEQPKLQDSVTSVRNRSSINNQNFSKLVPSLNLAHSPADKNKQSEGFLGVKQIYPNIPFYSDVPPRPLNKDYSKEIKEDVIYFPQNFPNYNQPQDTNTDVNSSSSLTHIHKHVQIPTKPDNDREKLVEFNPKQVGKNRNVVTNLQNGARASSHFPMPKAVTTKDFFSYVQKANTPPSLITISSDNIDDGHLFSDPTRSRNKVNRTNNYVLQRKPSLLPDIPGTYKPRKPNVRLTTGMLAGILIAALIFLGFLTGTMVFAFHQLKFGTKPKKDRHKKRTTVYAPEYLDENFAGNTYIHNNIFLPNPQNLEDRLSTEMDTTFSVDSEETAQVTDRPSTSGGNTRNKTRDE